MSVWRKKPVEQVLADKKKNKRGLVPTLGVADLTALGVGAVIGTGIFVLTGVAAANYAGPGVVFSFILSGIAATLAAMVYAELGAAIPSAGSAYTFSYVSLGEIIAWLVGWNLILEYLVAAGAVSIGWSSYMGDLLQSVGITLPAAFTSSPFDGGIVNLPAALIVLVITGLIITGTQHSTTANKIIVVAKLAAIALFIALGVQHINPANWRPVLPYGISGVFHGAAIVFFAYIGFDAVATASEEVKNPQRDLPRGIIWTLVISTLLYIVVAGILTGMVKYTNLNTASPVATALLRAGIPWASALVSVGALAGLTSVLLVAMYGQSRIFFAMARDDLLPPIFDWLHPRLRTPVWDSIIIGVLVALIGAFLPIGLVAELANIGTLTAFIAVSTGAIILRRTNPDLRRPFRLPWMPAIPVLTIISAGYLAINLPPLTWVRFIAWVAIGLVVYWLYGYRKSKLARESQEVYASRAMPEPARKPEDGKKV
ncbi:amino acid permease [Desulfoscipio geothermicus]|uniref:Amino acid/polyamine/organocation transporter, APC superfamily n=1 Tax=Desulfoscipio geothermicus DSM 3669 TaxID=1121426 RepID=A0A1I6DQM6_9FIRM|nr:amino acid permease [Desulfoscipio geothermicus]SFR07736.1 amino acid/polyamine/organocation transporter, APC superfamily [Desulfoscipio geothermicus DSM 3669]